MSQKSGLIPEISGDDDAAGISAIETLEI